jgi:hypothetical protein
MAKGQNDRREQRAAEREAFQRGKRRKALLWKGALVLAVAGVAGLAYYEYSKGRLLDAVTTASYPAGLHATGTISYAETPPVGGTHHAMWQNCGIYDVPVHSEHAVHAMEHGAVWITYRPDLPADQVAILKQAASDDFMLLSPFPGLIAPVVASAWNHQLPLSGATDPALRAFIGRYKNNPQTTPEFGAPCAGGTSAPATSDTLGAAPTGMIR